MDRKRIYKTGLRPFDLDKYPTFPYCTDQWAFDIITEEGNPVVVIKADTFELAYGAAQLLYGSITVIDPDIATLGGFDVNSCEILPDDDEEVKELMLEGYPIGTRGDSFGGIPAACMLAVNVFDNPNVQIAIFKLSFSNNLLTYYMVDLDPSLATEIMPKYSSGWGYVLASNAIINAYSAIEELGFDVRASQENPSRVNGVWNPDVQNDLEQRLVEGGVDLSRRVNWDMRGDINPIDEGRPTVPVSKPWWSDYEGVRDESVEVIDAIADSSWIRSKVAAHRTHTLTKELTPYHVSNVQHLARRLIIENTGIMNRLIRIWYPEKYGEK